MVGGFRSLTSSKSNQPCIFQSRELPNQMKIVWLRRMYVLEWVLKDSLKSGGAIFLKGRREKYRRHQATPDPQRPRNRSTGLSGLWKFMLLPEEPSVKETCLTASLLELTGFADNRVVIFAHRIACSGQDGYRAAEAKFTTHPSTFPTSVCLTTALLQFGCSLSVDRAGWGRSPRLSRPLVPVPLERKATPLSVQSRSR